MPTLQKVFSLEITPQQFIDQCSSEELQELDMLCQSELSRRLKEVNIIDMEPIRPPQTRNNAKPTKDSEGWYTREPTKINPRLHDTGLGHNGQYGRCSECEKLIRTS